MRLGAPLTFYQRCGDLELVTYGIGGVIAAGLYPLTSAPGLPDDVGTDMRYLTSSRVSASYALHRDVYGGGRQLPHPIASRWDSANGFI